MLYLALATKDDESDLSETSVKGGSSDNRLTFWSDDPLPRQHGSEVLQRPLGAAVLSHARDDVGDSWRPVLHDLGAGGEGEKRQVVLKRVIGLTFFMANPRRGGCAVGETSTSKTQAKVR